MSVIEAPTTLFGEFEARQHNPSDELVRVATEYVTFSDRVAEDPAVIWAGALATQHEASNDIRNFIRIGAVVTMHLPQLVHSMRNARKFEKQFFIDYPELRTGHALPLLDGKLLELGAHVSMEYAKQFYGQSEPDEERAEYSSKD